MLLANGPAGGLAHRVRKESYNTTGSLIQTEYYVRDASGTTLAVYRGSTPQEYTVYGSGRLGVYFKQTGTSVYQLTDHLGNVRALVGWTGSNRELKGATDYYPFGMVMPHTQLTDGTYRYAFQGQEKDPETGKEAFELRLWDARIGRWLTTDPYGEFHSPYLGMANNPVISIDKDGGCVTCPGDAKKGDTYRHADYDDPLTFDGANWLDSAGNIALDGFTGTPSTNNYSALSTALTGTGLALGKYGNEISKILSNKNSFVTIYEPVSIDDIIDFRQQDFDDYLELASKQKTIRVVNTELRSSIRTLSKSVQGLGYGAGAVGFLISVDEYNRNQISGELLALDGVMTVVSFAGPVGASMGAFYFIVVRGGGYPNIPIPLSEQIENAR